MELKSIQLSSIKEIIPNKLYTKFENNGIETIGDILKISLSDFEKLPYVGKKTCNLFSEFKHTIENRSDDIIELYNSKQPKLLPIDYSEESSFIANFSSIIIDYLELIKNFNHSTKKTKQRHLRDIEIIKKYYGINSNKYSLDQIGKRYRITTERARQIVNIEFIEDIKYLLNGEFLDEWNMGIRSDAFNLLQSFKKDLAGIYALNEKDIFNWLEEYGLEDEFNHKREFFDLLLKLWDFDKVGVSRHYYLRKNNIYLSRNVDSELFLNVSTKIYTFLELKVIPTTLEDIIIEVLEEFDVSDEFIQLCCNSIFEIERVDSNLYQLRFECLSSINDYAYRLLYEKKKTLSYNELLHLINQRLVRVDQSLTIQSLKQNLRKDNNIVPLGKTGNWALTILDPNIDSQIDLILKSFRILDRPLNEKEILKHIHSEFSRVDVSERSVYSNLSNYSDKFMKIKGRKFILSEWEYKYQEQIVKSKLLKNKRRGKLKVEKTVDVIKKYISSHNPQKMPLRELVKIVCRSEQDFSKMDIYKAISENPLIFDKTSQNKVKYVSLKTNIKNSRNQMVLKYKWNELKKILKRELEPIFDSSIQPNYKNSLDEVLDSFFKILTKELPKDCKHLRGLADRVLPTLYKFYVKPSDRNDKLNFLKQIVTSQESFFKILLYYLQKNDYEYVRKHNKGLGVVIKKLVKMDPRDNRYKKIGNASNHEFGKYCSRAYNNRNIDTHNANDWTEGEIIETKTSCLVMMVYACFEYYDEIIKI